MENFFIFVYNIAARGRKLGRIATFLKFFVKMTKKKASLFAVFCILLCGVVIYAISGTFDGWLNIMMSTGVNFDGRKDSAGLSSNFLDEKGFCKPVDSIVYIKTHKTGSTTLAAILYRYGYQRNSSFLFSRTQRLGHFRHKPLTLRDLPDLYPPINVYYGDYEHYKFKISAGHVIYNRYVFDLLMSGKPKYVTIIREPVKQFASYFSFFNFRERYMKDVNITSGEPFAYLEEFLQHADIYEKRAILTTFNGGTKKNPQFFDLGLTAENMDNMEYVKRAISQIEAEFDLVFVTEYFDESLVLLKKQLCWEMDDIVYFKSNVRHHESPMIPLNLQQKIREFNKADNLLYEHFNKTLWLKIQEYGPSFHSDLEKFRRRLDALKADCIDGYKEVNSRIVEVLKTNAPPLCEQLHNSIFSWFGRIVKKQPVITLQSVISRNISRENDTVGLSQNTSRKIKRVINRQPIKTVE
ncbi:galactosylceramide sulfotransferase-like [Glandiceps talaboti]